MSNKVLCGCIKRDEHGESDCKDASCDPSTWGFVCNHKCVIALTANLQAETAARIAAEKKLEKYRKAIQPFIGICRDVVSICDKSEEGGAK